MQNVIATPVTEAMQIDFSPTKIPPDTMKPTVVAQVKFDRKCEKKYVMSSNVGCSSHVPTPQYTGVAIIAFVVQLGRGLAALR